MKNREPRTGNGKPANAACASTVLRARKGPGGERLVRTVRRSIGATTAGVDRGDAVGRRCVFRVLGHVRPQPSYPYRLLKVKRNEEPGTQNREWKTGQRCVRLDGSPSSEGAGRRAPGADCAA